MAYTPDVSPYLHATWIPRYLTGDKSCLWACWFKANKQGYDRMPSRLRRGALDDGAHRPAEQADRGPRRAGL